MRNLCRPFMSLSPGTKLVKTTFDARSAGVSKGSLTLRKADLRFERLIYASTKSSLPNVPCRGTTMRQKDAPDAPKHSVRCRVMGRGR